MASRGSGLFEPGGSCATCSENWRVHPLDRSKQTLERIFLAARKAPLQPVIPASPEEIMAFSRRKVAGWLGARRRSPQPDPLWLWERVGGWSLGAALATLFLVLS